MACGIAKCPAEVLDLILELLSSDDWREVCLVNRPFRELAQPLLYSKIHWSWKILEDPPPIRPELGAYVLDIRLDRRSVARATNPKRVSNPSIPLIPISGAALDGGLEFIEKTRVLYHVTEAIVALLLAQLPNLRSLILGPIFTRRTELIGYVLPKFSYLKESYNGWSWVLQRENVRKTPDFLPLFYLPRIESLSILIRSSLIAAVLSYALPTLTEINISADCRTDVMLHCVKSLQIPLVFLVGFAQDTTKLLQDKLPRNVEHLTLRYDLSEFNNTLSEKYPDWEWEDSAVFGLLKCWLEDWKSWTPCLRGIHLIIEDVHRIMGIWDPGLMRQATDLGIKTGIHLEVSEREVDGSIVPREI
ncbi:hypothetical protein F1880_000454 [Penicillium rolfsii]|nr:hypothetical protein F1880_000454 [Penicillium rolfsii]